MFHVKLPFLVFTRSNLDGKGVFGVDTNLVRGANLEPSVAFCDDIGNAVGLNLNVIAHRAFIPDVMVISRKSASFDQS